MAMAQFPYIGVGLFRQSFLPARVIALLIMAGSLGGCAGLGLPFGDDGTRSSAALRNQRPAVMNASFVDRVDPSDWDSVRDAIVTAPRAATAGIDWENPITGTTGTMAVAVEAPKGGFLCRTFATTINDTRGIRRYRGDACQTNGGLQFRGVSADDAKIS